MEEKIRLLAMDVDGTLTDGSIMISAQGELFKIFDIKDGYLIRHMLPDAGIKTAIITGRTSGIVAARAEELKITHVIQGVRDKAETLRQLCEAEGIPLSAVAYIGDDLNDLPAMRLAALAACPADAVNEVAEACAYVCKKAGGRGAVREFGEYLMKRNRQCGEG